MVAPSTMSSTAMISCKPLATNTAPQVVSPAGMVTAAFWMARTMAIRRCTSAVNVTQEVAELAQGVCIHAVALGGDELQALDLLGGGQEGACLAERGLLLELFKLASDLLHLAEHTADAALQLVRRGLEELRRAHELLLTASELFERLAAGDGLDAAHAGVFG